MHKIGFLSLSALFVLGCAHSTERTEDGELAVLSLRHHYNNAHVVLAGERALLVDAGTAEDAEALDRSLREAGVDPEQLVAVVLTHGHTDHAGGAAWFRDHYGTPIVAGAGDAPLLASGRNDELCPTNGQARRRLADNQAARYEPFEADLLVAEPLDLEARFEFPARVVPVPGHTEGSLVVLAGTHALVGDLFRGSVVGHDAELHFYICEPEANRRDIVSLLAGEASEAETFFVGHFGPVTRDAVVERFGGSEAGGVG